MLFARISGEYRITRAKKSCSERREVKDVVSCIDACNELGLQLGELTDFEEGKQCYTDDNEEKCFQDGKNGKEVKRLKLICRKLERNLGWYNKKTKRLLVCRIY